MGLLMSKAEFLSLRCAPRGVEALEPLPSSPGVPLFKFMGVPVLGDTSRTDGRDDLLPPLFRPAAPSFCFLVGRADGVPALLFSPAELPPSAGVPPLEEGAGDPCFLPPVAETPLPVSIFWCRPLMDNLPDAVGVSAEAVSASIEIIPSFSSRLISSVSFFKCFDTM